MKRIGKAALALMLMLTSMIGSMRIESVFAANAAGEYPVSEDAFIRSDRGGNVYSNESITTAHGAQYAGKNYKVLNTKYYPNGNQIMSVMKLTLPTQSEVADNHYDTFEFAFHIFKNADYAKGPQTYQFYYTTDVSWSETSLSWNNKPEAIKADGQDLLFDFTIAADKEYEFLSDSEKTIRIDVSEKIKALIDNNVSEITIFTVGKDKKDTSLMIHSKESGDGSYAAKLIASNTDETTGKLQALLEECKKIAADGYTTASYQALQDSITKAQEAIDSGDKDQTAAAYTELMNAKANLSAEFAVIEDAFIRSDKSGTVYNNESITQAHGAQYVGKNYKVINAKRYENNNEIIGVMKFNVPTAQWLEKQDLDSFFLEFNMFKNPGFNNGTQTYHFYYTTDVSWSETSLTWKNKPASVQHEGANLLCDFVIEQGYEYETKNDSQKHIKLDISKKIKEIIDAGNTSITVFAVADKGMDTSIMFHSKESGDGTLGAKLTASYLNYEFRLQELIAECKGLDEALYAKDGVDALKAILTEAEALDETADGLEIHAVYDRLLAAKEALVTVADPSDNANIAYQKPTRSNLANSDSAKVTDGNLSTFWKGVFYPSYVDIDLLDTYDITGMKLYTPAGKKVYYTIYGSNDGTNYDRLYQKRDDTAMSAEGDSITFEQSKAYRIIRVYMEYTQAENSAYLSEVRVYGTPTQSNEAELKQGTLEEILGVKAFKDSDYAKAITTQETIDNVYGIIDRTIGAQYRDWFSFELVSDHNTNDWYEISDKDGKIHIKGNEGLSLTTGLNYYYKNYLNVHISEQTKQVAMPASLVKVNETIRKETPYQVRYAFNYCTLSYTFAFFGQEEWQRENDWLALNGVNVVLDLAGQEATWIKFLMNFGYSYDEAKDWLSGPAYYAWQFMDNMEVFGGPVPDGYVKDRLEMARASQRWKRSLGMQTILQGYAGMVPTNFNEYQPDVQTIAQGGWGGFTRPSMIATDSDTYDNYARLFYEAQEFVYGATSDYYAVDPFHEGGKRPAGLSDSTIADEVLNSMLEYDTDAVWVVQGWQSNPTNDLLKGMGDRREDHVLIVDLIKYPITSWTKYNKTSYGSTTLDAKEFNGTSWAWGLLANFGGNPSMHGQMEVMVKDILNAQKTSSHMVGLGIISEAQYDNPVMYDLIFDLAWADDSFDLDTWLHGYINRRYGATSENARMAWDIMKDANYNHGVRYTNELFGMKSKAPQDYGKQTIPYGAENLESALRLLLEDFDKFKDSECYLYDLSEIMRQQVSNYAVLKYNDVLDARNAGNAEDLKRLGADFLNAFDVLNEVASTQQEQLGGEWIGKAQDRASTYDDFAEDAFEMNAKALITSWGSRNSHGSLKDYGWRNYEGIFKDLNTSIWSEYLNRVISNVENGVAVTTGNLSKSDYFDIYWKWNLSKQNYTRTAKDSPDEIKAISERVLDECAISGSLDQNIGNVALPGLAEELPESKHENINAVNDGDVETSFIAQGENIEVIVDLIGEFQLSKINIAADAASSGYSVSISNDKNTWTKVGEKAAGNEDEAGITYPLEDAIARYIKVSAAQDAQPLALKEVRAYGERVLPDLDQLKALIDYANTINTENAEQDAVAAFEAALAEATASYEAGANPDEAYTKYWALYDRIVDLDLKTLPNLALHKAVTAHNDPSGHSADLTDGSTATSWNAGRLSITGKPYEDTITPGWAVVDLEDIYQLSEIQILFGNANIWHHYEVYVSEDNNNWTKVGEKKTNALPGNADSYALDDVTARYVKLYLTDVQPESGGKRHSISVSELIVRGTKVKLEKAALQEAIANAEQLEEAFYTPTSWEALQEALSDAKQADTAESMTQEDIDNACDALLNAVKQLQYKDADYTAVNEAVAAAKALNPADYVDFSAVQQAVDAVVKDKNITEQAAVDAMAEAINKAIAQLVKKAEPSDRQALQDAIAQAQSLTEADYTADSWSKLTAALQKAIAVNEQADASQAQVQACTKDLQQAVKALQKPSAPTTPDVTYHTLSTANIIVSGKMEEAVQLSVIALTAQKEAIYQALAANAAQYNQAYFQNKELLEIYDIKLLKNHEVYTAEGPLFISVKLLPQWIGRDIQVIYLREDGTFEAVASTLTNGSVCFNVDHLSYYGIVASKQQSVIEKPIINPQDNVLKPVTNGLSAGVDSGLSTGVETGFIDDHVGLYFILSVLCGGIVALYVKKHTMKTWK